MGTDLLPQPAGRGPGPHKAVHACLQLQGESATQYTSNTTALSRGQDIFGPVNLMHICAGATKRYRENLAHTLQILGNCPYIATET